MIRRGCALLLAALMLAGTAAADWSEPDENLARYEAQYAEASEAYKRIRYNAESADIAKIKEALAKLGYFPYTISEKYHRTMVASLRVFVGQMRLGGDGNEITPLMQAMLADSASLPAAISPVIDVSDYMWEKEADTMYTYARLTRASVQTDTKVGFAGRVAACQTDGAAYWYAVEMESDPEKVVYVTYSPLPRTTVFQPGDSVAVFGTTRGEQSFAWARMDQPALTVEADRIGYKE